ncbi:DoxX family protein [Pseudothioclava nitratireducens]|uniref:DoxX family protein n=1 Tax=Pseudothioclava nitratireducens TaxID=1928646 RepID=UPI0023DB82F7|nr:DoxX family protein [Defluviimonas nitratireducens]MDF1621253.1 DoxX family protein [Defluviimonas nitratireducens]
MTPTAILRPLNAVFDRLPEDIALTAARLFPAAVFWFSGRTKVDGLSIKPSTWALFEDLYALPVIPPNVAAVMATVAEHVFPVLLVLGLATRLSALALLGMTAVIQTFVFPEAWVTHGLWAACFLTVILRGPGRLSLDHWLGFDRR